MRVIGTAPAPSPACEPRGAEPMGPAGPSAVEGRDIVGLADWAAGADEADESAL
ncbi:hypothetical protein MANAM107_04150 [Actinomyces capricornis]|uniref:Uncharacterized protein n=1 Tax=Actinomyces capricornis TaxID=2755559 RepID=A0ABM7U7V6_9ACTO|nr:hypothetical protein MANAM107_04150 [Actinomyces capricornis]